MVAKRGSDHVPGNPLADYLQKHAFIHTTNSGAGPAVDVITTGMRRPIIPGSDKEMIGAWEIHAVTVRPLIQDESDASKPYAANSCFCHFQLLYDQYADILHEEDGDFDDLICGGSFHLDLATEGANSHFWPMALDVLNPRPVFSEYLTFASETPNVAPVNSCPFHVTLWYAPIVLQARQTELMLAMRARL